MAEEQWANPWFTGNNIWTGLPATWHYENPNSVPGAQDSEETGTDAFGMSMMAAVNNGLLLESTVHAIEASTSQGISPAYRGDHHLKGNRSAQIDDDENCALWLTGLPPHCDTKMLLGAFRNTGKVYSTYINPPSPQHSTAAAKVVFFQPRAAKMVITRGLLSIGGYTVRVSHNRIRVAAPKAAKYASRVLVITGPPGIIEQKFLEETFRSKFFYDIDHVIVLFDTPTLRSIEVRFGSFRAQAEAANLFIRSDKRAFRGVEVTYGVDPCGP